MHRRDRSRTWRPVVALAALALSVSGAFDRRGPPTRVGSDIQPDAERVAAQGRRLVPGRRRPAKAGRRGPRGSRPRPTTSPPRSRTPGSSPPRRPTGYFQPFTIGGDPRLGEPPDACVLAGRTGKTLEAEPKADFTPLAIGTAGTLDGRRRRLRRLRDHGQGRRQEARLRRLRRPRRQGQGRPDPPPRAAAGQGRQPVRRQAERPSFATFRHKATNAFQHGAAAVLLVNDAAGLKDEQGRAARLHRRGRPSELDASRSSMVSRDFADKLLGRRGPADAEELETQIDADLKPRSQRAGGVERSTPRSTIERKPIETQERGRRPRRRRARWPTRRSSSAPTTTTWAAAACSRARWRSSPRTSTTAPTTTPRAPRW